VGDGQRIDKWMWFARVTKTRTLAQKLALSGRVRVNREKNDSASRIVRTGDTLTIAFEAGVRVLRVLLPGARRGPASEARLLYDDLSPPPLPRAPRVSPPGERMPGSGRPTKRERRAIDTLTQVDSNDFPDSGE
jgi:ribosome-associated heat shock protein Hsp15